MKKLLVFPGLLVVLFCSLCATASADSVVLFGPQTFLRKTGAPETKTVTFKIPDDARNLYLSVKGSSKENQKVKNVSVSLNGNEVVNQEMLDQQNPQYLKVTASGTASLDVTLTGKPGDAVTIYLVGEVGKMSKEDYYKQYPN